MYKPATVSIYPQPNPVPAMFRAVKDRLCRPTEEIETPFFLERRLILTAYRLGLKRNFPPFV